MNKTERIKQGNLPIIGRNIRRLRKWDRMRSSDIVAKLQQERIFITTSALSRIEQGTGTPTTAQLIALRKIL